MVCSRVYQADISEDASLLLVRLLCSTLACLFAACRGGGGGDGQLGAGPVVGSALEPVRVTTLDAVQVSAGDAHAHAHTCAVGLDSGLWCWGDNFQGQVGDGTNNCFAACPPCVTFCDEQNPTRVLNL
jgi:alpha-tubulin suppressor-like RCC1 family protein